jgi:hypothetical protein
MDRSPRLLGDRADRSTLSRSRPGAWLTGRRAAKLYLPNGAFTFASRQAYGLAYRSQREAPHDRALRRAFKLRGKLGADGGIGDYVPKPKWMRWPTYDRKLEEIFAAEEVVDAHLLGFVQKLERRSGR